MAQYVTIQDLVDRFGEGELIDLTDKGTPATGSIDTEAVERAIEDAESEINGYLQARYRLPLEDPPRVLTRLAANVTRYYLHEHRPTEAVTTRYQDAIRFLKAVSEGRVNLGLNAELETTAQQGGVQSSGRKPIFDQDSLKDYTG